MASGLRLSITNTPHRLFLKSLTGVARIHLDLIVSLAAFPWGRSPFSEYFWQSGWVWFHRVGTSGRPRTSTVPFLNHEAPATPSFLSSLSSSIRRDWIPRWYCVPDR